jgi:signal transduction histidine kinase
LVTLWRDGAPTGPIDRGVPPCRYRDACSLSASPRRFVTPASRAADQATPEEAKALAERAAIHFKEVGPEKARVDFNDANGGFVDRELFVVVYNPDHKIVGSYGVPVLHDKDATTLKDVTGKEFGKEIIALAKAQGSGWVEYRMTNPVTKKVGVKRSWVIGLDDYVLFVGAFGS